MHRQPDALKRVARLSAEAGALRSGGLAEVFSPFEQEDVGFPRLGECVGHAAADGTAADNRNFRVR